MITVKPTELSQYLQFALQHNENTLITGAPGIGKTDIVKDACKAIGYDLLVSHPVVADPTDYKGLPYAVNGEADFLPIGDLKRLITADKPLVCFADDFGQAAPAVQAAWMQLLLARHIGEHKVSDHVRFVAATNRKGDNAAVSGILSPVKSRFSSILELEVNIDDWINWAFNNNMPVELIAFMRFRPNLLAESKPSKDMVNTVSPRTLAAVGRLQNLNCPYNLRYAAFAGAAGEGFATEYMSFIKMQDQMPDIDMIIKIPSSAPIPEDQGVKYALAYALSARINKDNVDNIITYLNRLPKELSVVCLKDASARNSEINQSAKFREWAVASHNMLLPSNK